MNFSREILYHRHRLSHQQIDQLLGEQKSGEYLAEKLVQMEQLREFFRITNALKEEGVEFICLKGPLLSQRIYGDPTFRYYKDFDLLVSPEKITQAILIFHSLGYQPDYFIWPQAALREQLVLGHLNQYPLTNPVNGINVELHWRLFGNLLKNEGIQKSLIKENQEKISMGGRSYTQFTHEFELLYLVIHGGLHGWRRLKWLVDINEMLKRFPLDENQFKKLSKKLKAHRIVSVCNEMLREFFPETRLLPCSENPRPFLVKFSRESIHRETEELSKSFPETLKRARFKLSAFPGLRYKLSAFRFSTFTQKEVNEDWFPPYPLLVILQRLWNKVFKGK